MRSVVTGLTCVALVAVLATWSLGEGGTAPAEPAETRLEVVVVEGNEVSEERPVTTETREVTVNGDTVTTVIVRSDDVQSGVVFETPGAPAASGQSQRAVFVAQGAIPDGAARQTLARLVDELASQAESLEKEGKTDEAAAKREAGLAIRRLFEGGARTGTFNIQLPGSTLPQLKPTDPAGVGVGTARMEVRSIVSSDDEQSQALRKELRSLVARSSEIEQTKSGEQRDAALKSLRAEMEQITRKLAERHPRPNSKFTIAEVEGGNPLTGGAPHVIVLEHNADAAAKTGQIQAEALLKASQALKEAGRHAEAQKLMAESEALRARAAAESAADHAARRGMVTTARGIRVMTDSAGVEVPAALKELQEQIRQLRQEVAEVKELLKKDPR